MKAKDKVLVKVPNPIPDVYYSFSPRWFQWATQLNQTVVKLGYRYVMPVKTQNIGGTIEGWYVDTLDTADTAEEVAYWLPTRWLNLVETPSKDRKWP